MSASVAAWMFHSGCLARRDLRPGHPSRIEAKKMNQRDAERHPICPLERFPHFIRDLLNFTIGEGFISDFKSRQKYMRSSFATELVGK